MSVGNKLYLFGGLNQETGWQDSLYVFDTGDKYILSLRYLFVYILDKFAASVIYLFVTKY